MQPSHPLLVTTSPAMTAALCLSLLLITAEPSAEQQKLLQTFRDEFVTIAPGEGKFPVSFVMGRAAEGEDRERPEHTVTFKHKFAIGKYEVTQELWESVMDENPSRWKGKRNSVEMLSYDEAQAFCDKATRLMRAAKLIEAQQTIRLPSEAEWEYCARAGTTTVYSFGDDEKDLGDYAWFTGNAAGNDPPVGAKKPNAWGLYDMHGYLWEWCDDTDLAYTKDATDGRPRHAKLNTHVLRSGSWKDKADRLTSSYRLGTDKGTRDDAVGLRCVLE